MLSILEITVGQIFACRGPRMTLEAFRDFGSLLGTDAPIHCDPGYAAKTPFENVIAQGPLLLAPFESWLCDVFGERAWYQSGRIRAKFLVPGPVGSAVDLQMTVREIFEGKVSFELHVRSGEALLAVAEAEITLSPPE